MATSNAVISINGVEIVKGIEIRFKTHNKKDSQFYTGKVMGIVNYDVAASYSDVDATHANMAYVVAKKEVTAEDFILVRTADKAIRPFAVSWIVDDTTFMRTDTAQDVTITIFNVSTEKLLQILTYIRDAGFQCEQKK